MRIRGLGLSLLLALTLAACAAAPAAEAPAPEPAPGPPPTPVTVSPTEQQCEVPEADAPFAETNPAAVGIDPAVAQRVTDTIAAQLTTSFRIYRHNCLVSKTLLDDAWKTTPLPFFSMTKTVVALVVGRAIELGYLDIDDPIGDYVPEADAAHGAITVYQLLTQSSGLRFAWGNDLLGSVSDGVGTALSLPFVATPGTRFEYAQTTVSLLAYVVQRAVGQDFQAFAATQLFEPIGIHDRDWIWERDARGNTHGYAWLSMTPPAAARLGTLVLDGGAWAGTRLIDGDYVDEMGEPTVTNESYGFLMPTNRGEGGYTSFGRNRFEGPRTPSAPSDLVNFSGFLDQSIAVVPSLDLVIVRLGFPASDGWEYNVFRELMPGITGVEYADPGPYVPRPSPVTFEQIIDLPLLIQQIVNANAYD